ETFQRRRSGLDEEGRHSEFHSRAFEFRLLFFLRLQNPGAVDLEQSRYMRRSPAAHDHVLGNSLSHGGHGNAFDLAREFHRRRSGSGFFGSVHRLRRWSRRSGLLYIAENVALGDPAVDTGAFSGEWGQIDSVLF